jgi:hypothetical protein
MSKNSATITTVSAGAATISKKQDILLIPIVAFFRVEKHIDLLLGILLTDKYKLSLRIIDWFVTNYSKKHNIVIERHGKPFIVYLEYKSQLKAYSKKQFDPFCRRARIHFEYAQGTNFETTIGQLNFFRWAIENNIIDYIMTHYEAIEADMTDTIKMTKDEGEEDEAGKDNSSICMSSLSEESGGGGSGSTTSIGSKKKSTITATKSLCKHNVKIVVSFD